MVVLDPQWIAAAQAAMAKWKVPASVSLAQFGLESGWGRKMPGNNPFGIKHMPGYADQHFLTHEVVDGQRVTEQQTFAVFATLAQAFDVHARLIATHPVYAAAMVALDGTATGLAKFVTLMGAHYATAPDYAHQLMAIIQGDALTRYDVAAK